MHIVCVRRVGTNFYLGADFDVEEYSPQMIVPLDFWSEFLNINRLTKINQERSVLGAI